MTRTARLEKHREAMRGYREKNKRAGRVDLRLGLGTEAERSALQMLLKAMRDPQTANSVEKVVADVSEALRTAPSDGDAPMKNSDTPPAPRVRSTRKSSQAPDQPLGNSAASLLVQITNRPNEVLSDDWFKEWFGR